MILANVKIDYDRTALSEAITASGVDAGDVLFCHSNVGFFGRPDCDMTPAGLGQMVVDAVFDVIGDDGTFVVPTFTYSFAKGQDFDPANTPSVCGMLTDFVMNHPVARRSDHPDFSVAAIGARAGELTTDVPPNAFGADSFFERFEKSNGKVCNFNFDAGSTFVHYVERTMKVPYRYDKKFFGNIVIDGESTPSHSINFVHDLNEPLLVAAFEPFHERAVETDAATVVPIGRGNVCTLSATGVREVIENALADTPFFLTVAHSANETPNLAADDSSPGSDASTAKSLPPVGVTIDTDRAFEILADRLPVAVFEVPTGTMIGPTIIPEKWQLLNAAVESANGALIANDQSISVAAHSRSFSGDVNRADLLEHVIESDDGECVIAGGWYIVSEKLRSTIDSDETYQVNISVRNTFGAMRYAILPGSDLNDGEPDYVSLSQDFAILEPVIDDLVNNRFTSGRSTLFYVAPFDPADIYAYHLSKSEAAS